MRRATIRLAPLAVLLSGLASAQTAADRSAQSAGTNSAAPVPGASNTPAVMSPTPTGSGSIMQGTMSGAAPTAAPVLVDDLKGSPVAVPKAVPTTIIGARVPSAAPKPSAGKAVQPAAQASSVLNGAAGAVHQGQMIEKAGGDGMFVRQALDKAFDASLVKSAAPDVASGRFLSAREKVSAMVSIANKALPADAPDLYGSAVKTAKEALPPAAAESVAKTVLSFAAVKAETSLSVILSGAFVAAAAGRTNEADLSVKALRKWEALLGVPGRPLLTNGDRIESALAVAAKAPDAAAAAAFVRVEKRGASYIAILPGSSVEKIPGLAGTFKLIQLDALSLFTRADAYRAFASGTGGAVYRARRGLGDSVPSAALSAGNFWLKSLFMRAWNALLSLLPGRSLPVVADVSSLPRLREAATSWHQAVEWGEAAASRAGAARVTVGATRGAFALARRAALAHEALTRASGAVARIDSLNREFESIVARTGLTSADVLPPGLVALISGEGGLRHWALLHAADARSHAATAFAKIRGADPIVVLGEGPAVAAAKDLTAGVKPGSMRFVASESGLWAAGSGSHGRGTLAADLRSTEKGGSLRVDVERGDEELARALDGLGFRVVPAGRGFRATVDADSSQADAAELAALAAEAAALITDSPLKSEPSSAGLETLLSDVRRDPRKAAAAAKTLDGRAWLSRGKTLGRVGELEAVASRVGKLRVFALIDPETRLPLFARTELLGAR